MFYRLNQINVLYFNTFAILSGRQCLTLVSDVEVCLERRIISDRLNYKKLLMLELKINRSTRPSPDVVPSRADPEGALHTFQDPTFETMRTNMNDDIFISSMVRA